MNSMTGYGRGDAGDDALAITVEIKSVNNRFLDVHVRVPREYMALEQRIQRQVKASLSRGKVDVFVRRSAGPGSIDVKADLVLAQHYQQTIAALGEQLGREQETIPLPFLLNQPGVLTHTESRPDAQVEWNLVSEALNQALRDLQQMRKTEGEALKADLDHHLTELGRLHHAVEAGSAEISQRLKERLDQRIERLIGDRVAPERLAQEAAILADKADVAEEIARIGSHCTQLNETLASSEPIGRRLEFLVQELNREVNTIGSKAGDAAVAQRVVDMKSVLERMREQAANVE